MSENKIFPNELPDVKSMLHAYKDGLFFIDGKSYTLDQVLTQLIEKINQGGPGGEDNYLASMAANAQGQVIGTMENGDEVEVDLSQLPEFDTVAQAQGNLDNNRLWLASANNNIGVVRGTMILNKV